MSTTCPTCKKNFEVEFYFLNHKRACKRVQEQGDKTYECNLCFKTYLSQHGLSSHKTVFHEGLKKFACSQCDKKYTDATPLRKHILSVHTKSGSFKCSKCEKIFESIVKRDDHVFRHHVLSKEKIQCKYCDCEKAYHRYILKKHEQAHIDLDMQKHKCIQCGHG